MDSDDSSAEQDSTSGTALSEASSAKTSAAFQALADMFANVKGLGPHRRYLLELIDGQLGFRQPEVDAVVEAAIAEVSGSNRQVSSCRRIIKLPPFDPKANRDGGQPD